jgi:hypothetical protein
LKKIKARQLETQSQLIDELQKELEDLM